MAPLPQYTLPLSRHSWPAPLNLASCLRPEDNPTDLRPKTYVAYGREAESAGEGDSVTKLHQDMTGAVNVLAHAHYEEERERPGTVRCGDAEPQLPSWGKAGAVWHIYRRQHVAALRSHLAASTACFEHHGHRLDVYQLGEPIFDQCFQLGHHHREALRTATGVEGWGFEQHEAEAVFIPAGCPHQVRNLRSCIKVAVDFVSPESLGEALGMAAGLRAADARFPGLRPRHPQGPYKRGKQPRQG